MWWWFAGVASAGDVVPVRTTTEIRVDGVLDEAVWQGAPITGFAQWTPTPGTPDRGTRAWVAYDDKHLYLAFDARVEPGHAQSNALSPRDRNRGEDTVSVLLDTFRDGKRAFLFLVNGRGIQGDAIFVDGESDLAFQADMSWDGVFSSAGTYDDGGFRVEVAIPFRALRFPQAPEQTWGMVLAQNVSVPSEVYTWPVLDPNAAGILVQAATLGPFPVLARPGRLEILPTLTAIASLDEDPVGLSVSPGIDARFGITTSLTAELTANPDFSQIESDTAQVSANVKFPLYYPELRPFFLENADLFGTPVNAVHTRSIVDPLGGYKLTGRVGPVALGWIGGYDQSPAPSTISVDYATGQPLPTWDEDLVADADAVDHIVRLRTDLGHGSAAGLLFTDKELLVGPLSDPQLLANRVGGVDGQVVAGRYAVAAQVLGSTTDFPDGSNVAAPAWNVAVHRQGERWLFDLGHTYTAPGFRAENGYLTEVGRTGFSGTSVLLFHPKGAVRFVSPGVEAAALLTPAGDIAAAQAGGTLELSLGDRWSFEADGGITRERIRAVDFDLWYEELSVSVRPAAAWFVGVDANTGTLPHYAAETPADLYRGFHWYVGPYTNVDLFGRMNVDARVAVDLFGPTAFGEPEYRTVIGRGQIRLMVTPRLWIRVIEQYDSYAKTLESSGLVGYAVNYGTAAYLGYTESVPFGNEPPIRTAFAKIGWLGIL